MPTPHAGQTVRYGDLEFFVEHGLIVCVDNRDADGGRGSRTYIRPDDLENRLVHLGWMLKRLRGCEQTNVQRDESPGKQRRFNDLRELAKIAIEMGSPADPAFQAFRALHRPGHKSTVSLRPGTAPEDYPVLHAMPLGQYTGREAPPDSVLAAGAAGGIVLRQPIRRKSRTGLVLPNM